MLSFILVGIGRPGACPKPTGFGICVEACSGDGDCPDNEKCCSNGCGHVCMRPGKDLVTVLRKASGACLANAIHPPPLHAYTHAPSFVRVVRSFFPSTDCSCKTRAIGVLVLKRGFTRCSALL